MITRFNALKIFLAIGMLTLSCNHETESLQQKLISGRISGHSECKDFRTAGLAYETPDSLSCVEYSYEAAESKLMLHHFNAGFNCCPGNLSCSVAVNNDTILITESEEHALCNCNCLYDLNIEVSGVENKIYRIKFIEPYIGYQEPLIFEADLPASATGLYCTARNQYPWGLSKQ